MSLVAAISTLSSTAPAAVKEGTTLTDAELATITQTEIDSMVNEVVGQWDMDDFDIDEAARLFGYEGFDPKIIYKSLMASAAKANLSDTNLRSDIGLLLVLHHIKGNISAGNFKSLKPEGQNMVNLLFERYGIKMKIIRDKKKSVTLPRIGACFPLQMAIIAAGNTKDFMGPYGSKDLPDFMKTSSFPSLIPIGDPASKFLQLAYNAYATDQHIALTKKNYSNLDAAQKTALYTEQLKFSDISYQSPVMNIDSRKRAMTILGIGKHYTKIKKVFDATGLDQSLSVTEAIWDTCVKSWIVQGVVTMF